MSDFPQIIAVIPAFNEAKSVGTVRREVLEYVSRVIVVDDGSSDATSDVARAAGASVVRHIINRGQGAALQTGISVALSEGAQIVVTFDADGQFVASEIPTVVEPLLLNRVDVVFGSRFLKTRLEMPFSRLLVLHVATAITRFYTGLRLTDTHNGFRALSRLAAETITIRQRGMAHASEIIEQVATQKLRYVEVPVTVRYTEYSLAKGQKASQAFKIVWELLLNRIVK